MTQPSPEQQAPLPELRPFCGFRPLAPEDGIVTEAIAERLGLVTFDRRVPIAAVPNATAAHLEFL